MHLLFTRMPEDDTYKCPDCNNLLHRREFRSHPDVCVWTENAHYNMKYGQEQSEQNGIQNFDKPQFVNDTIHCTSCDKTFGSTRSRSEHIKSSHEGIRYTCDHCKFKTKSRRYLLTHKQSKHGNNSFNCDQCEYKTNNKIYLKKHRKSQHLNKLWISENNNNNNKKLKNQGK